MKKYLTFAALLLTLASLGACSSNERPEWLGGENKRPAADFKPGSRRAPVLQKAPLVTPPLPQDYYNNEQMDSPPPPVSEKQAMNDSHVRKPFAGDPRYSTETETIAPVPPAPELAASSETKTVATASEIPAALEPKPAPVIAGNNLAPALVVSPDTKSAMVEEPKSAQETPSPSLISHLSERLSDKPEEPDVEKIKDKPYPKLSDVPERPAEFAEVKSAQEKKIKELTTEHDIAQEQREAVSAEPTEDAPKVKDVAPPPPKTEAKSTTKKSSKKKSVKPKSAAKKSTTETVAQSEPMTSATSNMSLPPGKYADQLQQEKALY
jgi:hypothetical protein